MDSFSVWTVFFMGKLKNYLSSRITQLLTFFSVLAAAKGQETLRFAWSNSDEVDRRGCEAILEINYEEDRVLDQACLFQYGNAGGCIFHGHIIGDESKKITATGSCPLDGVANLEVS